MRLVLTTASPAPHALARPSRRALASFYHTRRFVAGRLRPADAQDAAGGHQQYPRDGHQQAEPHHEPQAVELAEDEVAEQLNDDRPGVPDAVGQLDGERGGADESR